jgi:acetyl/propionyl-CoA carboxylase alpha subunit
MCSTLWDKVYWSLSLYIKLMGDKIAAEIWSVKPRVPVVPGSEEK